MRELIIHFGMQKTGSSSIQASLATGLTDPRFHYIRLGPANASRAMVTAFSNHPEKYHGNVRAGRTLDMLLVQRKKIKDQLIKQISECAASAILSAEGITHLNADELDDFRSMALAHGMRCKAIGYVRPPKASMESLFQQRVKGGLDKLPIKNLHSSYRNRVAKFDAVFGAENVNFLLFDPKRFPDNCVVQDFCKHLGATISPDAVIRANDGLSFPAISLLFAYQKFRPQIGTADAKVKEDRILIKHLATLPGKKLHFHSALVKPILEANLEDISWAEQRLGESLGENISAHDADSVRSERDLLEIPSDALAWLASQLGPRYKKPANHALLAEHAAGLVDLLRSKLAREQTSH